MHKLVLLRHGQSQWNLDNRFTGWHDVDLTDQGREEAKAAGRVLKENGFVFDQAHTSLLKRAIRTLWIALDELDQMWLPVRRDWRLNERHYGALQGLNKSETAEKHGEEQVLIWRRAYDIPPPSLEKSDERWPGHDARYAINDTKLRTELGWAPRESFETGLAKTVAWYLDNPRWVERIARDVYGRERLGLGAATTTAMAEKT